MSTARITTPVLFVHGDRDSIVKPSVAALAQGLVTGPRLRRVEGALWGAKTHLASGGPVGTALKHGRGQDRPSGSLLLRVDDTLKVAHEPRKRSSCLHPRSSVAALEGEGRLKTR
jgi:pimeloyl-ACP methyl ester carboxylesterase